MDLIVSPNGGGELAFSPDLSQFESTIPDMVLSMAQACLTLPALEVATIDVKFHEDPLVPVFPEELNTERCA